MGLREWLIKTLSVRENIPQTTITKIVAHNYEMIHQALKEHSSIEVAGFGKFYFNEKKAVKEMSLNLGYKKEFEELLETEKSETMRRNYQDRIKSIDVNIDYLKNKGIQL